MSSFEMHHASENIVLGAAQNLSLVLWRKRPTRLDLAAREEHYRTMMACHPHGFGSLVIIEENTPNPDLALRKMITKTMDDAGAYLRGVAVVLEARGFGGAALRAGLSSMSMLTSTRFPRCFVPNVNDALAWIRTLRDDAGGRIGPPHAALIVREVRVLTGGRAAE